MKTSNILSGSIIISIGVFFLLSNLNLIYIDFDLLYPVILIIVGFKVMLKKKTEKDIT